MRGPADQQIEGQVTSPDAAEAGRARPPGGKALLRLVSLLEEAGLNGQAEATLERALPPESRAEFRTRAARFSVAPPTALGTAAPVGPEPSAEDVQDGSRAAIAERYIAAAERLGPSTTAGPQWRCLGPWTIPNGQTYGASRVNVSGRVSAIATDPRHPDHLLCGSAHGGVWESTNRGVSWVPRTDDAATLTVGALAFDPGDPRTVYCGTGEGNWWAYLGAGLLRSTDGGTAWAPLCGAPFLGQGFYDLAVDHADGQHLLAATTGGLYTSNDGGVTWTQRRSGAHWSVTLAPPGAAAELLVAAADGVYRSADGGVNWAAEILPGAPTGWNRLAVAIAPSHSGVAYVWGASGSASYLYRRVAGSWTRIASPPGVNTGQAWYDWFLAVSPDRDTQVYCGAIEVHRGDLAGTTWSWVNLTNKGAGGDSIHPDQHAIAFQAGRPDCIYVGNDGGLFRSDDRGINWQHCNHGLIISEFEYLAQDHGSARWLIGGTQDNGTQRWSGAAAWEHVADGDGGDCGVNRVNPRRVFHTYYGMSPERSESGGDWGSWAGIAPPVPPGEGSAFYPPFECSATTGDTVAMGGDALYLLRDGGSVWTRLPFPSAARSSALAIPAADSVYVGTTDGRLYRSDWSGTSWSGLVALTTPRAGAFVSDILVQPSGARRIWATSRRVDGGRVFRSDDGGTTWTDCTAGLPTLPINAVEVDDRDPQRVWVAADLGVYQSLDGGASWTPFSNGLPNMLVGDLLFHPHARVLRVGTRNRGVWEIPVDGWMTRPQCGVQWSGNLGPNAQGRWFTHSWPATWHVVWTVMPTTPRPGAPQVSWTVQVERADAERMTYWITVKNLTPQALAFEGRFCILSRY